MNKVYSGYLLAGKDIVVINTTGSMYVLNPRLDLYNHSPTGYGWGYRHALKRALDDHLKNVLRQKKKAPKPQSL